MKKIFDKSSHNTRQAIHLPAKAPFIRTHQHDNRFEDASWDNAQFIASREGLLTNTLDLNWGEKVFQQGENGKPEIVAFHYDTTD